MLKIGTIVGGRKIASMPFTSEKDAKEWIKKYWGKNEDAKAVYSSKDGKWYIASR